MLISDSREAVKKNPATSVATKSRADLFKFLESYGLTPASRSKSEPITADEPYFDNFG